MTAFARSQDTQKPTSNANVYKKPEGHSWLDSNLLQILQLSPSKNNLKPDNR